MESAKDQIEYMGQIIGGARELVNHSGSNSQEAVVTKVIDGVIMLLRGTEGTRQASYQIEVAPGAEDIRANVAQLKQILFNLSRNAIEAIPSNRIPSIKYSVSLNSKGLSQFEVADNGTGFPKTNNDPFATLSTTKKSGLGLGLSLARTIVEAHGGRIWIESSGPEGATLAFTLQSSDAIER
jgi:two-component system sensor kinase FixL